MFDFQYWILKVHKCGDQVHMRSDKLKTLWFHTWISQRWVDKF